MLQVRFILSSVLDARWSELPPLSSSQQAIVKMHASFDRHNSRFDCSLYQIASKTQTYIAHITYRQLNPAQEQHSPQPHAFQCSWYLKANQLNMLLYPTHIRENKKEKSEKCTQRYRFFTTSLSISPPLFSVQFHFISTAPDIPFPKFKNAVDKE